MLYLLYNITYKMLYLLHDNVIYYLLYNSYISPLFSYNGENM